MLMVQGQLEKLVVLVEEVVLVLLIDQEVLEQLIKVLLEEILQAMLI